jgi:hypothetical protein
MHSSSVGMGVYYRYKDAVIISALANLGQYAIGLSYDVNTSDLSKSSTFRGGPEILLRYNSANPHLFQKK